MQSQKRYETGDLTDKDYRIMAEMPLSMTMTLHCRINEHLGCSYFAHLVHAHQRDMESDYTSLKLQLGTLLRLVSLPKDFKLIHKRLHQFRFTSYDNILLVAAESLSGPVQ